MNYYSVKLNVPAAKEAAIRSLVPDGEPVSGTLIGILLDEAARRGHTDLVPGATASTGLSDTAWRNKIERRIKKMEDRLDHALAVVLNGGGSR